MRIAAFDPCLSFIYCCVYDTESRSVTFHRLKSGKLSDLPFGTLDAVVVESQQVYKGSAYAGDLIRLATEAGRILGWAQCINRKIVTANPLPREWKGQTPKDIHNKRTLAKAASMGLAVELSSFPKGSHDDLIDALGLALWFASKGTGRPL